MRYGDSASASQAEPRASTTPRCSNVVPRGPLSRGETAFHPFPSERQSGAATADQGAVTEEERLREDADRLQNWKRWGPYLSERQWGTVREDYSAYGNCWEYFPHDHARSRVYRWGEDGLGGFSDAQQQIGLGLALWDGRDPILKE